MEVLVCVALSPPFLPLHIISPFFCIEAPPPPPSSLDRRQKEGREEEEESVLTFSRVLEPGEGRERTKKGRKNSERDRFRNASSAARVLRGKREEIVKQF